MSGANTSPGWVQGDIPDNAEWNLEFANKVDAANGYAVGLTLDTPTISGPVVLTDTLTLAGDPTDDLMAATKQYVDAAIAAAIAALMTA
ncbi:MAG TPA: hypothetical protein VGF65_11230 [Mycobacterium sp.]|jgi:hypothetical protein